MNYLRSISLELFESNFAKITETNNIEKVLIVGGDSNEPELKIVSRTCSKIFFINLHSNVELEEYIQHDMNTSFQKKEYKGFFDFIICNQVLEHVFDLNQALMNMRYLIRKNGFIWLTFPASNFYHNSPEFFSSGYTIEKLHRLGKKIGFRSIFSQTLCNQREYFYRHLLNLWPTKKMFFSPLLVLYSNKDTIIKKLFHNINTLPHRMIITFSNKKFTNQLEYMVESIVLFESLGSCE